MGLVDTTASAPLPDGGLIWAFRLEDASECADQMLRGDEHGGRAWLHFNLSNVRTRAWFAQQSGLDDEVLEAFADVEVVPQVRAAARGVLVLLYDLHHEFKPQCEGFGVLRLYFDGQRLITGRSHPLRAIDALKRDVVGARREELPSTLVVRYLVLLCDSFGAVVRKAADEADDAEDEILAGRVHEPARVLGTLRRLLARLRRHLAANRAALTALSASLPTWLDGEQRTDLLQAAARFDGLAQDLDLVQERARLLQEEIASRLVEGTNRNLYLLSLVTTVLVPVTLVTGMFGMNVGGIPWSDSPHGFFWITMLMLVVVGAALWLLHRNRIL